MIYDSFGASIAREYDVFLLALKGRYLSNDSKSKDTLQADLLALRQTFLKTVAVSVRGYLDSLNLGAPETNADAFFGSVSAVTMQNVKQIVNLAKQSKMNLYERMSGAVGELVKKQYANPEFKITQNGRTFKSEYFIERNARHFAYTAALDAKLSEIQAKTDLFEVFYQDPNHTNHGLIVSITGKTPGFRTLKEVADIVFHFNASAWIRPHVQA